MIMNRNIPPLLRHAMEGQYIRTIVERYAPNPLAFAIARTRIDPIVKVWANRYLRGITASGSFAKGTAVGLSHDVDMFVSLAHDVPGSLKEIYESLFARLAEEGLAPVRQNVSIGVKHSGVSIDVIPGRRLPNVLLAHALYKRKQDSWTKTNVMEHVRFVRQSGRLQEIKATKIWRSRFRLEFPSFYLELAVIEALKGRALGQLGRNFRRIMDYLAADFVAAVFIDPSNSNNVISDDLSTTEKRAIAGAAGQSVHCAIQEVLF